MFIGDFLGCELDCYGTNMKPVKDINTVIIHQPIHLDTLYVSKDISEEHWNTPPTGWNNQTVLYGKYNGSTAAGNLTQLITTISHILLKRRRIGDSKWTTIAVREVHGQITDMELRGEDKTTAIGYQYEYAIVPTYYGDEYNYTIKDIECKGNALVILDDDEIWSTPLTDGFLDTTAVVPNGVIETMYDKYPTIVRNTNANYETIEVNASFMPVEECQIVTDDNEKIQEAITGCYNFLRNGKPKLLKNIDGRIWLVYVTTPPTNKAETQYNNRKFSFTCTEIGDPNDEQDLYDAGLIDVPAEWWS